MPDIFDFFRENESKLQEKPPERVWRQLEKRLKTRRASPRKRIPFLRLSTLAAIAVALLLAAFLVWFFVYFF